MSKLHLVTFGNQNFTDRRFVLRDEAEQTGWFDGVHVYGHADVAHYPRSFAGRGSGWWWWKPEIVNFALNKIAENDILLYLDAGCFLNKHGEEPFKKYLSSMEYPDNNSILACTTGLSNCMEKAYTKRDLFKLLECDHPDYTDTTQYASGLFFIRKNKLNMELIQEWIRISTVVHCLDDGSSLTENYKEFVSHKNDQSVFSLLIKKFYGPMNINSFTLDFLDLSDGRHYHHLEELAVNSFFNEKSSTINHLRFPIITARLHDGKGYVPRG